MTDVVLFHHAQGLTAGIREFADRLGTAGHHVTVPDLYDGATFDTRDAGRTHAEELGFRTVLERGRAAVDGLPGEVVYAGFSLGVLPAQMLAQTRPGAQGAVLVSACIPPSEFGDAWPGGVPLQMHAMEDDALLLADGDLDVARELANTVAGAELHLYPGDGHLFADSSLPGYDAAATELLVARMLDLLG